MPYTYLDPTIESPYPLDEEDAQRRALRPFVMPAPRPQPPTDLPAPPPIPPGGAMDDRVSSDVHRLTTSNATPLPSAPIDPVEKVRGEAVASTNKLAQLQGNKPQYKPNKLQSILNTAGSAALGFGAGWSNAAGRTRRPIETEGIAEGIQSLTSPGFGKQQRQYQHDLEAAQAEFAAKRAELASVEGAAKRQAEMDANAAQTEKDRAQAGLYKQQSDTLAEEGKRGPRGNYITVSDGLWDAENAKWIREPSDKTKVNDMLEIAPEKGQALGLKPGPDGRYVIPKEGIGPFLTASAKPDKPLDNVSLAIRAAGGDPMNPQSITPAIAAKAASILKPQMPGINLTPEAVQFWAQAAAAGIPLPSMGMGASGANARQQIINAAPAAANGTPLAEARATQRADSASLAKMQSMRDAVVSFEKTALANLDILLNSAKPLIDSGSPLLNQPLRAIDRRALGSADLAAYEAARRVAINEIAKVTSNPTLAGQLSDSARHEVESFIPAEATLAQVYSVANILKQDMANRHKYLDESLGEIRGRMSGGRGMSAPMGQQGGAVHFKDNGVDYDIPADKVQAFMQSHPNAKRGQ
jgi:hypothetical protein